MSHSNALLSFFVAAPFASAVDDDAVAADDALLLPDDAALAMGFVPDCAETAAGNETVAADAVDARAGGGLSLPRVGDKSSAPGANTDDCTSVSGANATQQKRITHHWSELD